MRRTRRDPEVVADRRIHSAILPLDRGDKRRRRGWAIIKDVSTPTAEQLNEHAAALTFAAEVVAGELAVLRMSQQAKHDCCLDCLVGAFEETHKALQARAAKVRGVLADPVQLAQVQVIQRPA